MAYLGNDLQVAFPSYRNIDDISGGFDGVTTSFALTVDGVAPVPAPINSQQCLISVNGVVQRPDDSGTEGFRLSGGNIIFASAPAGGVDFFGVILAGADYVNVGANFPSGTAVVPSITFDSDLDTGIYNPAGNEIGFTTSGTQRLVINSSGQISSGLGTAAAPAFSFISDPNTGIYSPGADQVAISANSSERIRIGANGEIGIGGANYGTSGQVLTSGGSGAAPSWQTLSVSANSITQGNTTAEVIDTGSDGRFVVTTEGTERLRVDSSGRLGVGTTSPGFKCQVDSPIALSGSGNDYYFVAGNTSSASRRAVALGVDGVGGNPVIAGYNTFSPGLGTLIVDGIDIQVRTGSTERARIDSSGRLLVGTSSAPTINGGEYQFSVEGTSLYNSGVSLCTNSTSAVQAPMIAIARSRGTTNGSNTIVQSGDALGYLRFLGADGSTKGSVAAQILCEVDGTPGVGDMPGRLVFSTTADGASSPTERMRITADSNILIGKTTTSSSTAGARILSAGGSAGYSEWVRDGGNVMYINRMTDDGDLVKFAQADTQEGSISVSGTTVSYNGAHLSRWSQLPSGQERTEILRGSVLSNIDEMCEWGDEENEQLNRMKVSDVEGDKNVSGVFQCWDDDDDTYINDFYCAMTGDFIIRIAAGVTVERGDLLMSAGDGTAKPQDDDIIRSKTIAKVTSTNVSCTYNDGSYCVPCVLMAC